MIRVALAGNPNCGKTTLFNALTGSTAHVGNWPGVTVDKREGTYKKGSQPVDIVDLPGIYSLSPYTPEEIIARNYIIEEKPDVVINIVDASNLERNLYLTTQLLEMNVPVVVALNFMDVLEKEKTTIDVESLEKEMGIPVVPVSALKNTNLKELMERVIKVAPEGRKGVTVLKDTLAGNVIKEVQDYLVKEDVDNSLYHAIKLVENDEIEIKAHPQAVKIINKAKEGVNDETFGNDFEAIIADSRYKYIQNHFSIYHKKLEKEAVVIPEGDSKEARKARKKALNATLSTSDKIDKVLTNRVFGIIIFAVILFVIFHITFSEDFLYLDAIWGLEAIPSLGVWIQSLLFEVTGWIIGTVGGWLEGASPWVSAFICDGILTGIEAVLSFLPQILLLYLFFSILEDSGYMARVAFILDRIFRRFGVTGRAFMPMMMGFGCSIPAMANTRTLATEKERIATVRVIPFFSCAAKLPILTACAGALVSQLHFSAHTDLITLGMYVTGMAVAIIALLFMRNTTLRGETPPFIMELPAYRFPKFSALMLHVWDKCKHFVKKAFTIILFSTIIIWFLQSFTPSLQFIIYDEEAGEFINGITTNESILANLGRTLQVFFTPLGFGSQLKNFGWVFAVGAITGLIAKENVIATFAMLGAVISVAAGSIAPSDIEGATDVAAMIQATGIQAPGILSFIVFNMTTIPCFAAVATAKAELRQGTLKWTILFWLATSFIAASAFYLIGTWWWTAFIYAAAIAATIVIIHFVNKRRDAKALQLANKEAK